MEEEMKTLVITLLMLTGCASEWKCPNAPKTVAKFSVGERVAFTRPIIVDVSEYQFHVEVGDTGIVNEIEYLDAKSDNMIRYCVLMDKGADKGWKAHAFQSVSGSTVWDGWLETVVYPDPALAPGRK